MTLTDDQNRQQFPKILFLLAAALQIGCGFIFAFDVIEEFAQRDAFTWFELAAVIALAIGAAITIGQYRELLHRNNKVEQALDAASGAFQQVLETQFQTWQLTNAERDVALLSIKGVSISEIAEMRQTRVGTIKAQNAAIYRKSGVSNRAELVSLLVEEFIGRLQPG